MINLAQGFTFTVAGYGAWLAAQNISTNGFVVVAAGVMTGALAGALTGLLAFIPLYDKPNFPLRSLIATLAISLMGGQALLWLFTPRVKALPKIFGVGSIHIGPATVSMTRSARIVCSAILLLLTLA
jgi:branched-chain amino acid transport system permease protein